MKAPLPLPIPDTSRETEVTRPFWHENAEIRWAHKTLMEYPGTHFDMRHYFSAPNGGVAGGCTPCLIGWLAFSVTKINNSKSPIFSEIDNKFRSLIKSSAHQGGVMEVISLLHWGASPGLPILAKYTSYKPSAVPKAVLIDAFERVCRGERITADPQGV